MLKIKFYVHPSATNQMVYAKALEQGMRTCGYEDIEYVTDNEYQFCDVLVIWAWKKKKLLNQALANGTKVLLMERGYVGDRLEFTSLTWNGLNGLGTVPKALDDSRFIKYIAHKMQDWQDTSDKTFAVVIGQTPGDATMQGVCPYKWAVEVCKTCHKAGYITVFREHPHVAALRKQNPYGFPPVKGPMVVSSGRSLQDDLKDAKFVITYSSNTGVETLLAGIPTIAMGEPSMVYNVVGHDINDIRWGFDRLDWAKDLSYRQWTLEELSNGEAWNFMKSYIN